MLIGALFVLSAIFKAISVDEFDIYLYSFGVLDFVFCSLLSRLIIGFELVLGVMFILKLYYKQVWFTMISTTAIFTLFLVYVSIFRDDNNCHCMGDLVQLNPVHSIIKNLAIIGFLVLIRKVKGGEFKIRKWITVGVSVLSLVIILLVIPPAAFYNFIHTGNKEFNIEVFNRTLSDTTYHSRIVNIEFESDKKICEYEVVQEPLVLDNGSYLIGYIHSGCEFCKLGMKKIKMMVDQNNLNADRVVLFIWGDYEHISQFILETEGFQFEYRVMDPFVAVEVTYGKFPTFMFYKDEEIQEVFDYKNISERDIVNCLK